MMETRCPFCGESFPCPDLLRCPFCGLDLRRYTEEHARKHVVRCRGQRKRFKGPDAGKSWRT